MKLPNLCQARTFCCHSLIFVELHDSIEHRELEDEGQLNHEGSVCEAEVEGDEEELNEEAIISTPQTDKDSTDAQFPPLPPYPSSSRLQEIKMKILKRKILETPLPSIPGSVNKSVQ